MDLCPAFLLPLLASSAHVTFGFDSYDSYEFTLTPPFVKRSAFDSYESFESFDNPPPFVKRSASSGDSWDSSLPSAHDIIDSTMDKIRKDFEKNPLLSGLVKRSAASDPCSFASAGCAPGTKPAEIHHDCKCLTPEQLQNANSAVNCGVEIAGCAPGTQPMSINNVCKCLTPEQLQNVMDSTKVNCSDKCASGTRPAFFRGVCKCLTPEQEQIWLSGGGFVKRSVASDSCSAESAECAPGTQPASVNNVCKCLTPEQLKNVMDSTMDEIRKDFEKNPLLSGLVKRSASASECRAGCAPPTKEIWQTNVATGASVCKCLRPEQYLP